MDIIILSGPNLSWCLYMEKGEMIISLKLLMLMVEERWRWLLLLEFHLYHNKTRSDTILNQNNSIFLLLWKKGQIVYIYVNITDHIR